MGTRASRFETLKRARTASGRILLLGPRPELFTVHSKPAFRARLALIAAIVSGCSQGFRGADLTAAQALPITLNAAHYSAGLMTLAESHLRPAPGPDSWNLEIAILK